MAFEDQRTTVYKIDPAHPESETLPTLRTEELLLNMGPQHPATHGVLKVILELEGERLVKSTPGPGLSAPRRGEACGRRHLSPIYSPYRPARLRLRDV